MAKNKEEKETTKLEKQEVSKEEPKKLIPGVVFGCARLRLRSAANAKSQVITMLDERAPVNIDLSKSTESFYKIIVMDSKKTIDGFCMKKYIRRL